MRTGALRFLKAALLAGAAAAGGAGHAQLMLDPAPPLIDHRPAAAVILAHQGTLAMLAAECTDLLPDPEKGAVAIVRNWRERNRPLLEATVVWLDRFLGQMKGRNAEAFRQASASMVADTQAAVRREAQALFARKPPTALSCRAALAPFADGARDIGPPAGVALPQQQKEFLAVLQRIRGEPGFAVPAALRRLVLPGPHFGLLASAEAAAAARERGEGRAAADLYVDMANRGDGSAAQTLGVMLLEGKLLPRNDANAYRWFYIAWALGDQEGLNAIGVMLRDGLAVPADRALAFAAFTIAASRATTPAAAQRAAGNATELKPQVPDAQRSRVACLTLDQFNQAISRPIAAADLPRNRELAGGQRRLAEVAPAIGAGSKPACR